MKASIGAVMDAAAQTGTGYTVDKKRLPDAAFADRTRRRFPHHWVRDGGDLDDEGLYTTGTMFLHRGGLNAAWAAAQGARSGQDRQKRRQQRAVGRERQPEDTQRRLVDLAAWLRAVFPTGHGPFGQETR